MSILEWAFVFPLQLIGAWMVGRWAAQGIRRLASRSARDIEPKQTILGGGKHDWVPPTPAGLRVLTREHRFYVGVELLGGCHDGQLLPIPLDAMTIAAIEDINDITAPDGATFRLILDDNHRVHAIETKEIA